MSNFHPLEVVGRGSDTHFQVGANLNDLKFRALRVKDEIFFLIYSKILWPLTWKRSICFLARSLPWSARATWSVSLWNIRLNGPCSSIGRSRSNYNTKRKHPCTKPAGKTAFYNIVCYICDSHRDLPRNWTAVGGHGNTNVNFYNVCSVIICLQCWSVNKLSYLFI